jgi:hypothetical protein
MEIILERTRHEVPAPRNGKPGYRWAVRYYVRRPNGAREYPPVSRREAYARAAELGATSIRIVEA